MALTSISLLTLKLLKPLFLTISLLLSTYNQLLTDNNEGFSYDVTASNGPQNWGNLSVDWGLCGNGTRQSPINIQPSIAVDGPSEQLHLSTNYSRAQAKLVNKGHHMELEWTGSAGVITIEGTPYAAHQCHWHIPSEHTVNGKRFDMELHIVHQTSEGHIAVIGILYKAGFLIQDPFLCKLSQYLKSVNETGKEISVGSLSPASVQFDSTNYYRFKGSLTTPPCSQNVTWTIIKEVKRVTRYQINAIKKAVHDDLDIGNARPVQKLNGRIVRHYQPESLVSSF